MITPLPGLTTLKPGSATVPFPESTPQSLTTRASPSSRAAAATWCCAGRGRGCSGRCTTTTSGTCPTTSRASGGHVLRRRRRPDRRRRQLLAAGPHRRRDERLRAPAVDDRARVGAGRTPRGGRGGRDRRAGSAHGPDATLLRVAPRGQRAERSAGGRASRVDRREDRQDRAAQGRDHRQRPAQDPVGQDHAQAAAQHRRGRRAWRHDTLRDPAIVDEIKQKADRSSTTSRYDPPSRRARTPIWTRRRTAARRTPCAGHRSTGRSATTAPSCAVGIDAMPITAASFQRTAP